MADLATPSYDDPVPIRKRDPKVSRAFGRALKIARVRADMKRAEVGSAGGLRSDEIGRYERGDREPTLSVFLAIARALALDPQALLGATIEELARAARPPEN